MRFENNFVISWDKIILLATILVQIVWNVAIMPQRIEADLTTRYASKERVDYLCERLDKFDIKIDRLIELVQYK